MEIFFPTGFPKSMAHYVLKLQITSLNIQNALYYNHVSLNIYIDLYLVV